MRLEPKQADTGRPGSHALPQQAVQDFVSEPVGSASAGEHVSSDMMVPSGAVKAGEHVELARLQEALIAEQARSSRLDGELGYALLTIGRLRGRLREAGINPDGLFGANLRFEQRPEPAQTLVTEANGGPAARGQQPD